MSSLSTVIAIMLSAFITGGLARLAVPGPDPMPAWMTIAIGLFGSVVGLGADFATHRRHPVVAGTASFFAAVLLVAAYRRFVQKRPLFGPEALRFPRRGIGVQQYRERLHRAGVDPDALLDRALEERRRREHGDDEPPPPESKPD